MPHSASLTEGAPFADATWQRNLPTGVLWPRVTLVAAVLAMLALATREVSLREAGVKPSMQLLPHLWAFQRNRVRQAPEDTTVLLGSSRMAFGFDQDEWVRCGGKSRPFMLAWPGSCPRPILRDLAADRSYRGTVIVGVTPFLFFCNPADRFAMRTEKLVMLSHNWGPADEIAQQCRFVIQPKLAVLRQSELSVFPWIRNQLNLSQRTAQMPPLRSVQLAEVDEHGRMRMTQGIETRPELMQGVKDLWQACGRRNLYSDVTADAMLPQIVADVEAIQKRGGTVIFVRFPSNDWYRKKERARWPRERYWNRLIEETGCLGVHFEDHEELKEFKCPEWSHLTREDAIEFTCRLHAIIHRDPVRSEN